MKLHSKIPSPELSVIIPFHGDKKDLANCLEGLRNQRADFRFEIIVAESGCDPEVELLIGAIPGAVLVSSLSVMYPGKARNEGAAHARAELLAFIDADCVPAPAWLSEVYSALNNGNDIVMGPVVNLHPFHPVASIDNLLQFVDFQKHRPSGDISHFPICNLGIKKPMFLKVGGFPENMETGEDVLFSEAAINKGNGAILFNKRMTLRHKGRRVFSQFMNHHETFGFYRGYYNLRVSVQWNKYRGRYFYALFFGFRRLTYLIVRTMQWNPVGLIRIIIYFPVLIAGLLSWVNGFHVGSQKGLRKINEF